MLLDFLERFRSLNVLIVGDVILDSYWLGRTDRISPEAPVPVVLLEGEEHRLGGAANVALNVQALGGHPFLVSVLGQDGGGATFKRLMQEKGLSVQGLLEVASRPTTVKTRIVARHQQLLRCDTEVSHPISEAEKEQLWKKITEITQQNKIHVVIYQDYDKGVLSEPLISLIQTWADQHRIPTAVDPKKRHFLHFRGATLFKPNLREVNEGLGMHLSERHFALSEIEQAAADIRRRLHNTYTLITLGAKGMFLQSASQSLYMPTRERPVADVCGAGDTVISTAALGLAAGLDAQQWVALANLAGGQVCEQWGVVPVNAKLLQEEYRTWLTTQPKED